jgi:hypothetical protein
MVLPAAARYRHPWPDREHDPASRGVAVPQRCFAPEESRHSTPRRVVQVHHGALDAGSMT